MLFLGIARKDLNIHDDAFHAGRNTQTRILNVARLFAENHTKEFFLRRKLCFALRRHFADQNVAGLDFRADVNDAGLIEAI